MTLVEKRDGPAMRSRGRPGPGGASGAGRRRGTKYWTSGEKRRNRSTGLEVARLPEGVLRGIGRIDLSACIRACHRNAARPVDSPVDRASVRMDGAVDGSPGIPVAVARDVLPPAGGRVFTPTRALPGSGPQRLGSSVPRARLRWHTARVGRRAGQARLKSGNTGWRLPLEFRLPGLAASRQAIRNGERRNSGVL